MFFFLKDGVDVVTSQQIPGLLFILGPWYTTHSEDATIHPWGGILAEPPRLTLRACPAWVLDYTLIMRTVSLRPGLGRPGLRDSDINHSVNGGRAGIDSHKWDCHCREVTGTI